MLTSAAAPLLIETYCKCSWALANKMSNFNSNFLLKWILLTLSLTFFEIAGSFFLFFIHECPLWESVDHGSWGSTTVKDRGLRLFPMALRQKLWQQKENWPSGKMEHGNECKCQLFFDLYYAKILTVFPNWLGTSHPFQKLIPSSRKGRMIHCKRRQVFSFFLFNKSHLTELIKCFLEEKHICQVQLDG